MMAALSSVFAVMVMAFAVHSASATNYTVGAPDGSWDLRTNFTLWAWSKNFTTGDKLIFNYTSQHNVIEGNKAMYDSCSTAGPIMWISTTGHDVVPLTAATTRYFICGVTGHCNAGMKLAITVVDANTTSLPTSSPAPSSPSSALPPAASTSPSGTGAPSPTASAPPPTSGAGDRSLSAKAAVGFGLGVLMIFAL